jgi:hypothetical protein
VAILLDIPRNLGGGHTSWSEAAKDPRATDLAVEALACFRRFLGDPWGGWERGVPLARDFFMSYQGLEPEGVKLYRLLRALDGVRGLAEIVRTLGREARSEYVAAVMGLEFCAKARAVGCEVEFVTRNGSPSPDMRIRVAERWVTVELKALHDPDEMDAWHEFEQRIVNGLAPHGLIRGDLAFDRELTEAALDDPEAVLEGLAAVLAGNHRDYQPLPRGTGRARIAPGNCGKLGYPIDQTDDLVRLATKLRQKWWKQLASAEGPTLLIVRAMHVFGWTSAASVGVAARRAADVLAPGLQGLPMVGAVLVYDEPLLPPVWPAFADAGDVRVRMDAVSGCARMMALVPNPSAGEPLTQGELSRFVGHDIIW